MDEYDYQVNNLAVDLRDGIRIARLIELHSSGAFQLTVSTNINNISDKNTNIN
jgi:hypothetical protein